MATIIKKFLAWCRARLWNAKKDTRTASVPLSEERFQEILNAKLNKLWNALQHEFQSQADHHEERLQKIRSEFFPTLPKPNAHAIGFKPQNQAQNSKATEMEKGK